MSVRPETHFLQLGEGRVAYDDTGEGLPVVCVPGMGDVRAQFRYLREELLGAGWRVVTVDPRGQGESSADWAAYTPGLLADDIVALVDEIAPESPVVLAGNSMAAASAIKVAGQRPERVAALVLLGPVARDGESGVLRSAFYTVMVDALFSGAWGANAWASYYRSLYPRYKTTHEPADLEEYIAVLKSNLTGHGRLHALRAFALASKADCTALIGHVKATTLVVEGSKDPDVADPAEELAWLQEQLGAEGLLLDGIGHYPHVEAAGVTGPAVVAFLGRVAADRST